MPWTLIVVTKDGHTFSQLNANKCSRQELVHRIESLYGMGQALDLGKCINMIGDIIVPTDNISHIVLEEN